MTLSQRLNEEIKETFDTRSLTTAIQLLPRYKCSTSHVISQLHYNQIVAQLRKSEARAYSLFAEDSAT